MPIPSRVKMHRPVLEALKDGSERPTRDIIEFVASHFQLTDEEKAIKKSSGGLLYYNRAAWACFDLKEAGLIEQPTYGKYKITESGLEALKNGPDVIDNKYISQFKGPGKFPDASPVGGVERPYLAPDDDESKTPDEAMDEAFGMLNSRLADDILSKVTDPSFSPQAFERLTVDLLQKMGYGAFENAGSVTSYSHDGGIDGIIKEDRLGLSLIYIQAKKWDASSMVSRPELQKFAGAIPDHGKGVFVTTAKFSSEAKDYAKDRHIILIDGARLARLMIEHNFGARVNRIYEIKSVDTDFFSDYMGG